MALTGFDFNAFPKLMLNASDMSSSYRKWQDRFTLCVEMTTLKMGNDDEGNPKFAGRIKMLALLNAIGDEGLEALSSVGFDRATGNYDGALTALRNIYVREESGYVKTNKFVTAKQTCGEDEVEFYHRIEKLSRGLDYIADNNTRNRLSVSIAVNGLRDSSWRKQLMAEADLTWDRFCTLCKAKVTAKESEDFLSGATVSDNNSATAAKTGPKQEVDAVDVKGKRYNSSSKRDRRNSYSDSSRSRSRGKSRSDRHSNNNSSRYRSSSRDSAGSRGSSSERSRSSRNGRNYRDKSDRRDKYRENRSQKRQCIECNSSEHFIRSCPYVRCFYCKNKGHTVMDCIKYENQSDNRRHSPTRFDRRRSDSEYSEYSDSERKSPSRSVRFNKTDQES